MAPLTPHWTQPSHPEIQDVVINDAEFTTKSFSKVALPPFAVYAKMDFPPCTMADTPTYATVQIGRDRHLNLNSDLLYINHSCEPSLIFDTSSFNVLVGPKGLKPGDELTFFYPSTEWDMAQPFDCLCGTPTCRGRIGGAGYMTSAQLEGAWLNRHIHELLEERKPAAAAAAGKNGQLLLPKTTSNGVSENGTVGDIDADPTAQVLKNALQQAEGVVAAVKAALASHAKCSGTKAQHNGHGAANGLASSDSIQSSLRRGPTSRELSGEMGGDTIRA